MVLYGYDASVYNAVQGSKHWVAWFNDPDDNMIGLINTVYTPKRAAELKLMRHLYSDAAHHDRLMRVVDWRLGHALAAHAESSLGVAVGEATADGAVSLEAVYCLGLCSLSPSAMLDGRIHARLNAARLDALIEEARA